MFNKSIGFCKDKSVVTINKTNLLFSVKYGEIKDVLGKHEQSEAYKKCNIRYYSQSMHYVTPIVKTAGIYRPERRSLTVKLSERILNDKRFKKLTEKLK